MEIKFIRINEPYEPYITVGSYEKLSTIGFKVDGGEYRLTSYKTDEGLWLYTYGFMAKDPKHRPGHGGEWSSRPAIINGIFDTDLVGVNVASKAYDDGEAYYVMAMDRKDVPLPANLTWRQTSPTHDTYGLTCSQEFPRNSGYFSSTTLDAEGNLIDPKPSK
jgi:hypothetical protein